MKAFKLLDCVALVEDLPEFQLQEGDLGVVLEIWKPGIYEVEFTAPEGFSAALLTIAEEWLRKPTSSELKDPRPLAATEFIGAVKTHPRVRTSR